MQMELDLQLEDRGEGAIDGSLDFSTDLYTAESASRMAGHLQVRASLPLHPSGSAPSRCLPAAWPATCRCVVPATALLRKRTK